MQSTTSDRNRVSGGRSFAINSLLALGAVLLTLATLEGCARLVDLRPETNSENEIPAWVEEAHLQHDSSWLIPIARGGGLSRYFDLFEWDRYRFYRLRKNAKLEMIDFTAPAEVRDRTKWHVETNSHGFRDREFAAPGPGSTFRIAAVGDSSTFGWGVDEPLSFVAVAESMLAAKYPEIDIEVLNFGTPGHSSFQGLQLLQEVLQDETLDAVWFSFGANDRLPTGVSEAEQYARRASWIGAIQAVLQNSQAYQTGVAWRDHWRGPRSAEDIPIPEPGATVTENVTLIEYTGNLRQAAQLAQAHDRPFALISSCLDREGIRAMRRVAREQQVPFVNGLQTMMSRIPELQSGDLASEEVARVVEGYGAKSLQRWGSRGWVLMPDRCHPNVVGHRLIGEAIAEVTSAWIAERESAASLH